MVFFRKIIFFIFFLFIFLIPVFQVFSTNKDIRGLDTTMKAVGNKNINEAIDENKRPSLSKVLGVIIGGLLGLLGSLFFVTLVYGGFMWMTAQGNDTKIEKSKTIVVNAILGLVVILLSYIIADTIMKAVSDSGLNLLI